MHETNKNIFVSKFGKNQLSCSIVIKAKIKLYLKLPHITLNLSQSMHKLDSQCKGVYLVIYYFFSKLVMWDHVKNKFRDIVVFSYILSWI